MNPSQRSRPLVSRPRLGLAEPAACEIWHRALCAAAVLLAWLWLVPSALAQVAFDPPRTFEVGQFPLSVAVGEFNDDDDPDLAVANADDSVSVLLGGLGGDFDPWGTLAVGQEPHFVAVGEFNGDSHADLAVANYDGDDVSILLGIGGGGFGPAESFPVGNAPTSIGVGDFNGDGDPDLAVANSNGDPVFDMFQDDLSVLLGSTGGDFGPARTFGVGASPESIGVGDFNGDADPDLVVSHSFESSVAVLLGASGGDFGPATFFECGCGGTVAVGNFDAGTDLDLAVEGAQSVSILRGSTGGDFARTADVQVGNNLNSLAIGDFNSDGDSDLVVTTRNDVLVVLGEYGDTFGTPLKVVSDISPFAVAVADFNRFSAPDVVFTNWVSPYVTVLLNTSPAPAPPPSDVTPPDTFITSGPTTTTDTTPTFEFSSNEAAARFECRMDLEATVACSSPYTVPVPLREGPHVFQARASDVVGNTDGSPAEHHFRVRARPTPAQIVAALARAARSTARSIRKLGIRGMVRPRASIVASFRPRVPGALSARITGEIGSRRGSTNSARSIEIATLRRKFNTADGYQLRLKLRPKARRRLRGARAATMIVRYRFRHAHGLARVSSKVRLR